MTARSPPPPSPPAKPAKPSLDEELDRERLEPGLTSDGRGNAGANPAQSHDGGNSNT